MSSFNYPQSIVAGTLTLICMNINRKDQNKAKHMSPPFFIPIFTVFFFILMVLTLTPLRVCVYVLVRCWDVCSPSALKECARSWGLLCR